jgi:hypothetical protein
MRWIKRLAILFILLVLATALGIDLFMHSSAPRHLERLAQDFFQQKLHRQVEWGGLRWHTYSITIDSLKISERPGFVAGTWIEATHLRYTWQWESLLANMKRRQVHQIDGVLSAGKIVHDSYEANALDLRWNLQSLDASGQHFAGWITLHHQQGFLHLISSGAGPAQGSVLQILNTLTHSGALRLGLPNLEHVLIDSLDISAKVNGPSILLESLTVQGPDASLKGKGTIDSQKRTLAMGLDIQTPAKGATGSAEVSLQLSGPLANPQVRVKKFTQQAFQAKLREYLSAPESTRREIREQLKSLFK